MGILERLASMRIVRRWRPKINTPLVNIPQSLTVVTREFMLGHRLSRTSPTSLATFQASTYTRAKATATSLYIRGVNSSANLFVNGFRDDVQIFRDLYNAQSVEVLKGPSAILPSAAALVAASVNRTLKEADGQRIYEATAQTGSFLDRRFTLDAGQAVDENVAVRL